LRFIKATGYFCREAHEEPRHGAQRLFLRSLLLLVFSLWPNPGARHSLDPCAHWPFDCGHPAAAIVQQEGAPQGGGIDCEVVDDPRWRLEGDYYPFAGSGTYAPKPDGMSHAGEEQLRGDRFLFQERESTLLISGMIQESNFTDRTTQTARDLPCG
jgi:hypothetical protein